MLKEKLRNCENIDLSRFVVDLRERHLEFWTLYLDDCPREHNSKILAYNLKEMVCTAPQKGSGYSLSLLPSQEHIPKPPTRCHSQCCPFQTACPHPSLWDRNMEPQVLPYLLVWGCWWWTACNFPLHTPPYSVSSQGDMRYESLLSEARAEDVSTFLHQNNSKLYFFSAWTDCF
jgi:hypothetical protein